MPLLMSAFSPKANIGPQSLHVRFGSKADIEQLQNAMSALPPKADICGATSRCPLSANSGHRRTYSITSSARPISVLGMLRPSALAVLRLRTISTFVACCTGRSETLSPLRMRPV